MDVEGPGDLADGLPLIDEFAHERLLIRSHFWWPAKGDAALASVDKTVRRSLPNKGALEFGNAGEDRQNHPTRWTIASVTKSEVRFAKGKKSSSEPSASP